MMKLGQLAMVATSEGIEVKDGKTGKTIAFGYTNDRHQYDGATVLRVWSDVKIGRMTGFSRRIDTVICCYIDHNDYERMKDTK